MSERGKPKLVQRENGYYYVRFNRREPVPGTKSFRTRSKWESLGTEEKAEAHDRFARWLKNDGFDTPDPTVCAETLTISELWDRYDKEHVRKETAAPDSSYYAWKNLKPHFGLLTPSQIDQTVVDDYEELRADGEIGKPSIPATVRRELLILRACLNWNASPERGKRRLLDKADLPAFALPDESDPRERWLTSDEIKAVFAAAAAGTNARATMFLWLALETAARKRAIYDLTWDRVDFETGMIHYAVPGRKTTKKRRASVPISAALRPVLEAARKPRGLVLPAGGDVWAPIQAIVIRAGLAPKQERKTGTAIKGTGISPHTLRHTAATHMARRGVPLFDIAGVLGNSLAVVEKVYAKHCPGRLRAAVNSISSGLLEPAE